MVADPSSLINCRYHHTLIQSKSIVSSQSRLRFVLIFLLYFWHTRLNQMTSICMLHWLDDDNCPNILHNILCIVSSKMQFMISESAFVLCSVLVFTHWYPHSDISFWLNWFLNMVVHPLWKYFYTEIIWKNYNNTICYLRNQLCGQLPYWFLFLTCLIQNFTIHIINADLLWFPKS